MEHASDSPRLGHEYQVEVPSMLKESERLKLRTNPADSDGLQDNSLSFAFGLPFSVMQIPKDAGDNEHDSAINATELAKDANIRKSSILDNEEGRNKPTTIRFVMKGDSKSGQLYKSKNYVMAPATLSASWTDADTKSFLLGLFIFGKNFFQIKRFLENKTMGEILSFYYGKFYKSSEYRRWSGCRKIKGRKCVTGKKLFTGQRQNELLSRLIPQFSEEYRDQLLQIFKSYAGGRVSLEEYISSLKSTVGLGVLVEAVGIGKEKEDLTTLVVDPGKKNRKCSAPNSKAWSSLGPDDIVKFLTGGFQPSIAESKDVFWEAVWPRLLARGWHFEQPKNPLDNSSIPQAQPKSENGEMMAGQKASDPCLTPHTHELVDKPPRTSDSDDGGSSEQQPDIHPRRHSTRNRPLSVRAMESLANELLHVQRRKKRKDTETHNDAFSPCRKARTGAKTTMNRHNTGHGTAV